MILIDDHFMMILSEKVINALSTIKDDTVLAAATRFVLWCENVCWHSSNIEELFESKAQAVLDIATGRDKELVLDIMNAYM